ncbi:MAG: hypothetical protein WBF89_07655 [Steroidobacteraceae bacterium]
MKLLEIVTCARPVLFANDSPEFPFSVGGTAFIVKFLGWSYVITAKHVVNLRSFEAGQFCIQYRPDAREFLPLGALHLARGANEGDSDQCDIAVREVDDSVVREELYGPYQPYSLLQMDRLTIFSERGAYIYRGYPISMREVDFENHNIEQGAVTTRAEYVGRTPYESIHELRLLDLGPLPSIDGLSGSPVFQVHNEEGTKYSREAFAGMLIRGSIESGKIFLIEHRRIIEVLLQIAHGTSP